jgi:hypothetical protein
MQLESAETGDATDHNNTGNREFPTKQTTHHSQKSQQIQLFKLQSQLFTLQIQLFKLQIEPFKLQIQLFKLQIQPFKL